MLRPEGVGSVTRRVDNRRSDVTHRVYRQKGAANRRGSVHFARALEVRGRGPLSFGGLDIHGRGFPFLEIRALVKDEDSSLSVRSDISLLCMWG